VDKTHCTAPHDVWNRGTTGIPCMVP